MLGIRSLHLIAIVSLLSFASLQVWGNDVSPGEAVFEYVPSKLDIDYHELAPYPLGAILSQGEVEWLQNAEADYADDTNEVWRDDLVLELSLGTISEVTIENLHEFTPRMLTTFAAGLDPSDPVYGGLWSVGNAFIASKVARAAKSLD